MRFLFVMDPAESMHPEKDTSFALMRGAMNRSHECLHCLARDLFNVGRDVFAKARPIRVSNEPPHVELGEPQVVDVAGIDGVFIRKDPPFDLEYLRMTQQLDLVKDQTLVVNDPQGLRDANEKMYTFFFAHLMPKSLVTCDTERILDFCGEVGGRAVLKSLDSAGGTGVVQLVADDRNARAIADIMTLEGKQHALVQEYQPAVRMGDKRVLMLNGQPMGAILRVPRRDDFRANIHVGGRVERTDLTEREKEVVEEVGPHLRAGGLWFVGLDLIGEKLIEVNVTSPTGIQELGRLNASRPEEDVIEWAEEVILARE